MADNEPMPGSSKTSADADEQLAKEVKDIKVGKSDSSATLKIVALPKEVIHVILKFLDIPNLINFSQTAKYLKDCVGSYILKNEEKFAEDFRISSPNNLMLRHFGHVATQIIVDCAAVPREMWEKKKLHILPVIARRCVTNLKCLMLKNIQEDLKSLDKKDQEDVSNLFLRLKKMSILDCHLNGWADLMKSKPMKVDRLSLEYRRMDSWNDYIRSYAELKALFLSGLFSRELFASNKNIQKLGLRSETLSKTNLKVVSKLPHLKTVAIDISGPRRTCVSISHDFSALSEIVNLYYLYVITSDLNPMKIGAYIKTFLSLQNHTKLRELHFFIHYAGPETEWDPKQVKERAFPNLAQLSTYSNFPFLSAVPQIKSLVDLYFMESSRATINNYELYRDILLKMPHLKRLYFDVLSDITKENLDSLQNICRDRPVHSKLMVMVQNYANNIVKAIRINNTVIVYPVFMPLKSTKNWYVFEKSCQSSYDRARLLSNGGECVAVNYMDFAQGLNTVDILNRF